MSGRPGCSGAPEPRKSMRARQKRSFGDDFIDPTAMSSSPAAKKKSTRSSESPAFGLSKEEKPDKQLLKLPKEYLEKLEEPTEELPTRATRSSKRLIKAVPLSTFADREIKSEDSEELDPNDMQSDLLNPKTEEMNMDETMEHDDSVVSNRCPTKISVSYTMRKDQAKQNKINERPNNRLPPKNYNTKLVLIDNVQQQGMTKEDEERLNSEAATKVAAIRAANVQKILAKRSLGRVATGSQQQAQDEEISRYVATTSTPMFVHLPGNEQELEESLGESVLKKHPGAPAQFVTMKRTIVLPPKNPSDPAVPGPKPEPRRIPPHRLNLADIRRIASNLSGERPRETFPSQIGKSFQNTADPDDVKDPEEAMTVKEHFKRQSEIQKREERVMKEEMRLKEELRKRDLRRAEFKRTQEQRMHVQAEQKRQEEMKISYKMTEPDGNRSRQLLIKQSEPIFHFDRLYKEEREDKNIKVISEINTQRERPGELPSTVRTITLIPNSMHIDSDGNQPGPSTRGFKPSSSYTLNATPKQIKVSNILPGAPTGVMKSMVVQQGQNGAPHRIVVLSQPPPIPPQLLNRTAPRYMKPSPRIQFLPQARSRQVRHSPVPEQPDNLVSVRAVRTAMYEYSHKYEPASKRQMRLHPNQPQIVNPEDDVEKRSSSVEVTEVKKEVEDVTPALEEKPSALLSNKSTPDDLDVKIEEPDYDEKTVSKEQPKKIKEEEKEDDEEEEVDDDADDDGSSMSDSESESSRHLTPQPTRVFLGAQEPMKDLDDSLYNPRRYTIKTVKQFTAAQLRPFMKRPVGMSSIKMGPGAKGLSSVLIGETDSARNAVEEWHEKEEKKNELRNKRKIETIENQRQQKALAQKISMNEMSIWEYMQSEEFKKQNRPTPDMRPLEQVIKRHNCLERIPAYSDTLSGTNPLLYNRLKSISEKANKEKPDPPLYPVRRYKRKSPLLFGRPYAHFGQHLEAPPRQPEKPIERKIDIGSLEPPKKLKVIWNGQTEEVPEWIWCHLCNDLMRLCMRKSYYKGELREYPAYRCLRKGCQTFRSIKKLITPTERARGYRVMPLDSTFAPSRSQLAAMQTDARNGGPSSSTFNSRPQRARKNKFNDMANDYVCSTSAADAARGDIEEELEDVVEVEGPDEESDEFVRWILPGGSSATSTEELRTAIMRQTENGAVEKKEPLDEEYEEKDFEENPYDGEEDYWEQIPYDEDEEDDFDGPSPTIHLTEEKEKSAENNIVEEKPEAGLTSNLPVC